MPDNHLTQLEATSAMLGKPALLDRPTLGLFCSRACPGGVTEAFAAKLAARDTPLLTLDEPANANLVALGARAIGTDAAAWPAELGTLCAG